MRATPDDILGMAFFARVVEARSFSVAARVLGVSKSAVSARVARLEESLGVRLLHRTTRRLALTADGVRLYEVCSRIAAEADEAASIAAGAGVVPRGTLRVHAASGFAQMYLAEPIGEFLRAHPGLHIDLRVGDRLPERIDELDVAIVIAGRLGNSDLTVRKLASVRVATCASPTYLRKRGIPFRPQDLVLHDCLSHAAPAGTEDRRFQTDEGPVSMAALATLVADDALFVRQATLSGLGIAMLPELLVIDDLARGRLHRVLDDYQAIELAVQALHPHGRLPSASVRAFLDHLAASFRKTAWERRPPESTTSRAAKRKGRPIAMTEQDVRRLTAVADLYADVDAEAVNGLRDAVARAKTMAAADIPRTTVTMNSRIRVRGAGGTEEERSLVYPWDAQGDRVSVLSPFGLALLGATVGSSIEEEARSWSVRAIPYQPEAAGDHHL